MQCNVGRTDRAIRIILGITLVSLGMIMGTWWGLLGLIPLTTGVICWCPMYAPFRLSTYHPVVRQPH